LESVEEEEDVELSEDFSEDTERSVEKDVVTRKDAS
jgi:hypothetical protein